MVMPLLLEQPKLKTLKLGLISFGLVPRLRMEMLHKLLLMVSLVLNLKVMLQVQVMVMFLAQIYINL
jgi:hypothetical protein